MTSVRPQVGNWYKEMDMGHVFEVVAVDEAYGTIEAQLIDGELCEYDLDSWRQLNLERVEEPEDWRNAFELSDDDYRHWDDTIVPETWNSPLDEIESDVINGIVDDYY